MKGKEHKPLKKRSARAGHPGRPYRPSRTSDWLLAVPTSLVGKADTFTPSEWAMAPHGPEGEWGGGCWGWYLTDPRGNRTVTVRTVMGSANFGPVAGLSGLDWAVRNMPRSRQRTDQWALFHREVGCARGARCPEALREAAAWDMVPADVHAPGWCPMALLEPGTWRRVAQFTR